MKSTPEISELSDYPSIKKLASALHQLDANRHGAAIMIGAGFSRSAAHHAGGEKKMPLWNDFSKRLLKILNPTEKDISFLDPLRVAEEYRAYFGQAALNDEIRFEIDDEAWRPGELYSSLLSLPWSEVLTTNWDTLLERAAKNPQITRYFTPVTKPSDITWAQSPRIVKLHGTIGVTDVFIAAQEDYRSYPENFAPFVNFARQVFIENELCLLGFSGDDPNFLQWAGWIRDHLAGHARKIYLVGALNLSAARRKYLESINIAPIDLWDAVRNIDGYDLKHRKATELFLTAMKKEGDSKARPHYWEPSALQSQSLSQPDNSRLLKEPEYAAEILKKNLKFLQIDRESYPGWLVCPPLLRWRIRSQLRTLFFNSEILVMLATDDRAKLLYEIAWRHSVTFEYIDPWLAEEFFQFANPNQLCSLSKHQQMELALIILKNSRWLEASANDKAGNNIIDERIQALIGILKNYASYLPDCNAELAYHQALVSLDNLDFAGIESVIEQITGEDPVWKLRQAALLIELGRHNKTTQLLTEAYRELRERYRFNQNSIPILSRLAWSHWLLKAVSQFQTEKSLEPLPATFKDWQCDPWIWIEDIKENIRKRQEDYLKNLNPIEPLFDQGHYRNNAKNHSVINDISGFLLLQGLCGSVGIPLQTGSTSLNINLLASTAEKLVLSSEAVDFWNYSLAIRAASSENSSSIKSVFTRIGIASATEKVVAELVRRLRSAVRYWSNLRSKGTEEQRGHALSTLRVLMEVLARLSVRVSDEEAAEIFKLAVSLGQQKDFQDVWLSDVIDHLLSYSLKSIPNSKQGGLLFDALEFPLCSEVFNNVHNWPNPIINYPYKRETYTNIDKRIGVLIASVTPNGSNSSTAALVRLLPLYEKGFLLPAERKKLATAIWGETPDYRNLPNIKDLFPHAFLLLPVPDEQQVKALVQRHLYEQDDDILKDTEKELRSFPSQEIQRAITVYAGMANAAANERTRLLPSVEQSRKLFERLMMWRPRKGGDGYFEAGQRSQLTEAICNALSYAILPALSSEMKSVGQFNNLQEIYVEEDVEIAALPAFVYFVTINDEIALGVEKFVRKALQGRDNRDIAYAVNALYKWSELSESTSSQQFKRLVSRLINIIEYGRTVGLQHLLWLAGELIKKQQLSKEQIETLKEALINAFDISDYTNIDPNSREAINASSIREECVKLAKIICDITPGNSDLESMIKKSRTDALPEVRFAIEIHDSFEVGTNG